jgi:hypothetical protein
MSSCACFIRQWDKAKGASLSTYQRCESLKERICVQACELESAHGSIMDTTIGALRKVHGKGGSPSAPARMLLSVPASTAKSRCQGDRICSQLSKRRTLLKLHSHARVSRGLVSRASAESGDFGRGGRPGGGPCGRGREAARREGQGGERTWHCCIFCEDMTLVWLILGD